jgi:hypothetical protein
VTGQLIAFVIGAMVWVCSAGGCGSGTRTPDAGPRDGRSDVPPGVDPRAAVCAGREAGTSPVGYDVIQTVFNQNCVICHVAGNDLDLRAGVSWANLVSQPAPISEACGGTLVVPGSPGASYLYQKLTDPAPCTGSQMPRTDLFPDPLPACVTALVSAWIGEGASGPATDGGADR